MCNNDGSRSSNSLFPHMHLVKLYLTKVLCVCVCVYCLLEVWLQYATGPSAVLHVSRWTQSPLEVPAQWYYHIYMYMCSIYMPGNVQQLQLVPHYHSNEKYVHVHARSIKTTDFKLNSESAVPLGRIHIHSLCQLRPLLPDQSHSQSRKSPSLLDLEPDTNDPGITTS